VNGHALGMGDALLLADEPELHLANGQDAEVLVFDLVP
ncbi:MAG: quercetin 2,3-dioxygenase, partial [Burkholderiaceae bacterium]